MKKDDDEDLEVEEGEVKRSSRNLNEKRRRDRFNILLQQLAGIVSNENEPRKLDKTTVLKHAINFLQNHQSRLLTLPETSRQTASWQPSFTTDEEFNLIMLEALESLVLAINNDGHIVFASQSVLPLLGYLPDELEGTSLFRYMDDGNALKIWSELRSALDESDQATATSDKKSFQFLFMCGNHYSKFSHKVVDCKATVIAKADYDRGEKKHQIVIVGKVLHKPQLDRIVTTADCQHKQFTYRLSMDWKYLHVDHRASSVIGFLPFEVLGNSVYEYCSPDELFNIAQYHRILIRLGKVTTCYYRHLTKGQSWVWLQSRFYISYNQWNSKPESICGTATVVNFEEVCAKQAKILQNDREYFNRLISARNRSDTLSPIGSWPSSPAGEPDETTGPVSSKRRDVHDATTYEQKETKKSISMPRVLKSLMETPSDQIMEILSTQSDMQFESEEEQRNEHLAWLENVKVPSNLTSVQLTTHVKLLEEYKKIAEQIRKQERQLKMIKKLIEWSNLLLEVGSNVGGVGDSSVDSEASSTSNFS